MTETPAPLPVSTCPFTHQHQLPASCSLLQHQALTTNGLAHMWILITSCQPRGYLHGIRIGTFTAPRVHAGCEPHCPSWPGTHCPGSSGLSGTFS